MSDPSDKKTDEDSAASSPPPTEVDGQDSVETAKSGPPTRVDDPDSAGTATSGPPSQVDKPDSAETPTRETALPPGGKKATPDGSPSGQGGNGNGDGKPGWRRFLDGLWKSQRLRAVAIVAAIVVAIFLVLSITNDVLAEVRLPSGLTIVTLLKLAFIVILIIFVDLFTRPLTGLEDQASEGFVRLKRYWMMFAYSFMVLALIAAVYPFTVDYMREPHDEGFRDQISRRLDTPISLLRGCVVDGTAATKELHCYPDGKDQPPSLSWVLNAGGHATSFADLDSSAARTPEEVKKAHANAQEAKQAAEQALAGAGENFRTASDNATTAEKSREELGDQATPEERAETLKELEQAIVDRDAAKATLEKAQTNLDKARTDLIWKVYEVQRFTQGNAGYGISGGLVVPFYLVVLSLIGGAISLTRRVPEYQKQAVPGYVGTKTAPHLTPHELRESLVFQIVQFISAPFLAAVSYYILEPSTTAATVGLAFAAGFASETVLLWVRGVIDKLEPAREAEDQKGTVVGTIEELKGISAGEAEKALKISIIGHADLPVVFAEGGQFVINGVPAGAWAIEVTRQVDTGPQIYCRQLNIEAEKATTVVIKPGEWCPA